MSAPLSPAASAALNAGDILGMMHTQVGPVCKRSYLDAPRCASCDDTGNCDGSQCDCVPEWLNEFWPTATVRQLGDGHGTGYDIALLERLSDSMPEGCEWDKREGCLDFSGIGKLYPENNVKLASLAGMAANLLQRRAA